MEAEVSGVGESVPGPVLLCCPDWHEEADPRATEVHEKNSTGPRGLWLCSGADSSPRVTKG